jgi:dimethylaniline monooxygenase (N-oxide forming)
MRPAIADLTPDGVRFTDGSSFEADSILLCTGYRSSFEFLDIDLSDARTLFKSCFDPDTGPTLALMGQVRPSVGAIPPIAEMQARWFALLCSGRRRLPSVESMRHEANRDGREHRERFPCHSDRLPYLVDFTSYMDDLAARVGCKPRFRELLGRPRLAYAVYTGPFSAHQYRLRGPHAEPSVVEPVFERFPQAQALRRVLLQIASLMVCKLLAGVGFGSYRSHLSLASPNAGGEALPPPQSS